MKCLVVVAFLISAVNAQNNGGNGNGGNGNGGWWFGADNGNDNGNDNWGGAWTYGYPGFRRGNYGLRSFGGFYPGYSYGYPGYNYGYRGFGYGYPGYNYGYPSFSIGYPGYSNGYPFVLNYGFPLFHRFNYGVRLPLFRSQRRYYGRRKVYWEIPFNVGKTSLHCLEKRYDVNELLFSKIVSIVLLVFDA